MDWDICSFLPPRAFSSHTVDLPSVTTEQERCPAHISTGVLDNYPGAPERRYDNYVDRLQQTRCAPRCSAQRKKIETETESMSDETALGLNGDTISQKLIGKKFDHMRSLAQKCTGGGGGVTSRLQEYTSNAMQVSS